VLIPGNTCCRFMRDNSTLPVAVYHVSGEYAMLKVCMLADQACASLSEQITYTSAPQLSSILQQTEFQCSTSASYQSMNSDPVVVS
jgi:hypothetical protein